MKKSIALTAVVFWSGILSAQGSAFDVASVKTARQILGKDRRQGLAIAPGKLTGTNVALKELIAEAYGIQPFQITGGPGWLDSDEYEIDARAEASSTRAQLRLMLRTLLAERFLLALHRETKELNVYALIAGRNGPKLKPATPGGGSMDLNQLAAMLSVQLSIAVSDDPSRPGRATGAPVPVLNQTGLDGVYAINMDLTGLLGSDMFTMWQRVLQDQLGLRLENRKTAVEMLVIDRAERVPLPN